MSAQCVSLVWGKYLDGLQLAAVQQPPAEEEMSLHERDELIQSQTLFLPVAGRTRQNQGQSSHTMQTFQEHSFSTG